jgi:Icc-related predicted phosphoesterase
VKLLLTSDLHKDGTKLLWLLEEAPPCDALLVAGDLLDIFSKTSFTEQTAGTLRWREAVIATGKSFAWCSGNHDFFHDDKTAMSGASPLWMKQSPSSQTCVTDGETRILHTGAERIAMTTIPWPVHGSKIIVDGKPASFLDFVKHLLREGKKLRAEERVPWLILCHEPPGGTPSSATSAVLAPDFATQAIKAAEPDFSLHGHFHNAPTAPGGAWIWRIGKTICFNAGQSSEGRPPQYILLEWHSAGDWTAHWHAEGRILRAESAHRESTTEGQCDSHESIFG